MAILFDLTCLQDGPVFKSHGGKEYAKAVFIELAKIAEKSALFGLIDKQKKLDIIISELINKKGFVLIGTDQKNSFDDLFKKYKIRKVYSALIFQLLYKYKIKFPKEIELIITIHGLRGLELLHDKYEYKYIRTSRDLLKLLYGSLLKEQKKLRVLKGFNHLIEKNPNLKIITVSEHSKSSLLRYYPLLKPTDIKVFYSPISDYYIECDKVFNFSNLEKEKYFIMLSAGIWIKNSYRLVKAFDGLLDTFPELNYKLVLTGYTLKKPFQVKHKEAFLFLNYQERSTLEILIKNAYSLIYPSLNEGFGYPPLEAFKYGVPVLSSGIGPVYETCGLLPVYFNPHSIEDIQIKIVQILNSDLSHSEKFRNELKQRYYKIKELQFQHTQELIKFLLY